MLVIYSIMCYMLVALSILILLSGLDDLFFDFFYWIRLAYRLKKVRKYDKLSYEKLVAVPEKKIAVLVPCWHESNVIEDMLKHNIYHLNYENYDFFVGVYPNDPDTVKVVERCAATMPHIQCVIGSKPGPTTKADNLNGVYAYIRECEQKNNIKYEIIIFHDSEDLIHPLSFKIYNYLIPRKDMVQLPVFPLEVSLWNFTHWVYNDEFAENHTKDIVVREAIKGQVPSAGVATGFSRHAIDVLAANHNQQPFTADTLTEDYHTALLLHLYNMKSVFVTQVVKKTTHKKRWIFWGKPITKKVTQHIASRALFPTDYSSAVRQKARWITGIVFQEWELSGWPGNFITRYTLFHDRKALVNHYINGLAYLVTLFWIFYSTWVIARPQYPTLQEFFNQYQWAWYLILVCTFIMFERLAQRFIACYRVYGLLPALLSIPRAIYGNIINLHAVTRAYRSFFFHLKTKKKRAWDKTDHTFPGSSQLMVYNNKLGELLIKKQFITNEQLKAAINQQLQTGERLGETLIKNQYIKPEQLAHILAEQYHMQMLDKQQVVPLTREALPLIRKKNYHSLLKYDVIPIKLENNILTLAIQDPSDMVTKEKAIELVLPYQVQFVLSPMTPSGKNKLH